jgi:Holliday junction resolvasome RuvABC endonuclease subunit
MRHRTYVGIDPGTTNLAVVAWGIGRGEIARWKPSALPPPGVDRLATIMLGLTNFLGSVQAENNIEHICMEGYAPTKQFGTTASGEVGAAIKLALVGWANHEKVGYPSIVGTAALKKFTIGKGNAPKDEMKLWAYRRWQFEERDNNIVDAFALARVAHAVCNRDASMPKYQLEVLDNLSSHTEWTGIWPPNLQHPTSASKSSTRPESSSRSATPPAHLPSPGSSRIRFTKGKRFGSVPSAQTPSTKPSRRASSPVGTQRNEE